MSVLASVLVAGVMGMVCQQPADLNGHVVRIPDSVQWGLHDPNTCHWGTAPDFSETTGSLQDVMEGLSEATEAPSTGRSHEGSACMSESQVVRETLYFDFDSAYPLPSEVVKLLPLARSTVHTMSVQGFTDRHGPQPLNDRLARDRARSVWKAWTRIGGPNIERQLTGRGLCCYASTRDDAANRRVEITAVIRKHCSNVLMKEAAEEDKH